MTLPSPGSPVAIVAIPNLSKAPAGTSLFKSCGLLGGPLLVCLHAQEVGRRGDTAKQGCGLWGNFPSLTSDRGNNVQVLVVDVNGKNLVSNKISWWIS